MEPHTIIVICACIGAVLAVFGVGVKWILKEIGSEAANRAVSAQTILDAQSSIKRELKTVTDGHETRLGRLEDKSADFRSGKAVDDGLLHLRGNFDQKIGGVVGAHDKTATMVDTLKDRVTRLETKHEQTAAIVTEIKCELKETRHEINERFDDMTQQARQQFDQLCASIREVREIKPRS